ncbi:hypothetical protein GCM10007898_23500 [Dyella flagellata]|uniref:Uncharacterized protein n=1 Tax=Dyella flagellata TaxID=1867833 RepID=A0ABQ5XAS5_9GAMM|nr:hypothetical protein GCM10007898_23500 [Dyella flagellata]
MSTDQLPSKGETAACNGSASAGDPGMAAAASEQAGATTDANNSAFGNSFMSYPSIHLQWGDIRQAGASEYE